MVKNITVKKEILSGYRNEKTSDYLPDRHILKNCKCQKIWTVIL